MTCFTVTCLCLSYLLTRDLLPRYLLTNARPMPLLRLVLNQCKPQIGSLKSSLGCL
jgi:hypothetical protein